MPKRKYRSVPFDPRTAEVAPARVLPDKSQMTLKAEEDGNVEKKPRTYSSGIDCHIKKGIDKDKIISDYVSKYGEHVVSQRQGERIISYKMNPPTNANLVRNCKNMKPSLGQQYRVSNLHFRDVFVSVLLCDYFSPEDLRALTCLTKTFSDAVPDMVHLKHIDYRDLLDPRLDYLAEKSIDSHRTDMATACLMHYGMDPGMLVRYMQLEYTAESHGPTFELYAHVIDPLDLSHMRRIMQQGCPAVFDWYEGSENKMNQLARGNQVSFDAHPDIATKTLVKENKFSHLIPTRNWAIEFSPYMRHTPQGMVVKEGKNPRVVWDGSTKRSPFEFVLNEITNNDFEAAITFGDVKMRLFIAIYNWRVSFPTSYILLAALDVKACFRFARIHADLTGAFGFQAQDMCFLATSMVFGHITSSPSWEPFRRTIEMLSAHLHHDDTLVEKHKFYLDMISWDDLKSQGPIVKATKCALNPGVIHNNIVTPPRSDMYVDDALLGCAGKLRMKRALAATIEAIFIVMGKPNTAIRQCPLAMDKWVGMIVGPQQVMLGLTVDATALTVGITPEYKAEVRAIIEDNWGPDKRHFKVRKMHQLVGKCARLGEGAIWIWKLMSHMYTSLAFALQKNTNFLNETSEDFRELVRQIRMKDFHGTPGSMAKQLNFAMKLAAKKVHSFGMSHPYNETLHAEIKFLYDALDPASGIAFATPLAHIIPREPFAKMFGDSSLSACGGYCIKMHFVWFIPFPEEILLRTLLHLKNNEDQTFISINCLEFFTVIMNYCAALTVLAQDGSVEDPFPVVLNITDNVSALNWTLHTSKCSLIGRALARFFCGLMIGSPLGINSKWINTHENEVADRISRLKKANLSTSPFFSIDYKNLQQDYPELRTCRSFLPSRELLSCLYSILLTRKSPDPNQVITLRRRGLGKVSI